jgi:hypothetical protein
MSTKENPNPAEPQGILSAPERIAVKDYGGHFIIMRFSSNTVQLKIS